MPEYKQKDTVFYRGNQAFKFDFSASAISSDGAILLSEKVERGIGLLKDFASLVPDYRNPLYIEYTYEDMVRQRVFLMMQGYEDCNDEQKLRKDPVISKVLYNGLCSQPTLSRFENKADKHLIYQMCQWFVERYVKGLDEKKGQITIDVDGTDDPTHGNQQLSLYNGYYGQTMYHELLFKDGNTGQVILPVLRPGNCHSNKWFVAILKRIVLKIREKLPGVEILIRADSGFSGAAFYRLANQVNLQFCLGVSSNEVLKGLSKETAIRVKDQYASKNIKQQEFIGPMDYQAKSWDLPEKLYAKVESTGKGMNIRYFASNFENMAAKQIYFDFYVKRGDTSENRIKDRTADAVKEHGLRRPAFLSGLLGQFPALYDLYAVLRNVSPNQIADCQNKTPFCQKVAGGQHQALPDEDRGLPERKKKGGDRPVLQSLSVSIPPG
jgi:Transposase DDE domain group 1